MTCLCQSWLPVWRFRSFWNIYAWYKVIYEIQIIKETSFNWFFKVVTQICWYKLSITNTYDDVKKNYDDGKA